MPQGKGTYGSKVGRPSKKKKYQAGGEVNFPMENPSVADANQMGQELAVFPTANAQDRSQVMPDIEQYGEGGKVK